MRASNLRRWLNWVALVVVFSIACGFLANWQFSRRETKLASIELIQRNYSLPPTSITDVLRESHFSIPDADWRSVRITGAYVQDSSLLVRNRPNNGQPGFEQLVPFRTDTGTVIFISRGWLPTGSSQDSPDQIPLPPSGQIEIVGRLLPSEPRVDRGAPSGQIASIHVPLANRLTNQDAIPNGYLRLVSEAQNNPKSLRAMPPPSIDEGNNLSYAMQWMLFAIMAILALFWRIKKDRELNNGGDSRSDRKSSSNLDEEIEDSVTRAK